MKSIYIAINNLKDFFRNLKSNSIVFIMPIVFMTVFGFLFGQSIDSANIDLGILKTNTETENIINALKEMKNSDDTELFTITEYSSTDEIDELLKDSELDAGLIIENGKFTIKRDPSNQTANILIGVISQITNPEASNIVLESIDIESENQSIYQFMIPGLIVYGILILIPQVAGELSKVKEKNYIFRYFTSKTKSIDILIGFLISQTVIAVIQTIILILTAMQLGFDSNGNILPGLLFTLPVNFFVVGLGLLIGSFTTEGEAGQNLGTVISIILGFLSGSFVGGLENIMIGELRLIDIVPTYYATDGLRQILLYGEPLSNVLNQMIVILAAGLGLLLLGIIVYSRRQLRRIS